VITVKANIYTYIKEPAVITGELINQSIPKSQSFMSDKVKKLQERIRSQIPAFLILTSSTDQPIVQFVLFTYITQKKCG
jgi:hypothetical protein